MRLRHATAALALAACSNNDNISDTNAKPTAPATNQRGLKGPKFCNV